MPTNNSPRYKSLLLSIVLLSGALAGGSLSNLCSNGIKSHPKIKSLRYQESAKEFVYNQGIDQYLPQISLTANAGYEKYKYEYPTRDVWLNNRYYQYTLVFQQAIYEPVLLKQITDSALRSKLSRVKTADEKARLVTQIAQTSIELIRLSQIKDISQKKRDLYQKAYKQILSKFKMKLATKTELAQAKARLTKSTGELAKIKQQYRYTLSNLKYLANTKHIPASLSKKRFYTATAYKKFKQGSLKRLLKKIEKNTQVKIYKVYCQLAQNLIEMRKAEHYPTISFRASYNDGDYGDRTEMLNHSTVSLQVSVPIFKSGYTKDRVNEAQALFYSAKEDLDNSRLESKVSMEKNWEQIKSGLETLKALKDAEKAGKVYFETAFHAYENGLQSLTDTYLANIDYYDTKAARINAEADLLGSLINLYYIAGEANPATIAEFERKFLR